MGRTRSLAKKVSYHEPQLQPVHLRSDKQATARATAASASASATSILPLPNGVTLTSSSIICGNKKKSLRILMMSNKKKITKGPSPPGHAYTRPSNSKNKMKYVWPRTVESARDPNTDDSGKNKMFYLIAINLFPESKIQVPSDSEDEGEEEENAVPLNDNYHRHGKPSRSTVHENFEYSIGSSSDYSPSPVKPVRRGRQPQKRLCKSKEDNDVSWRAAYNNRKLTFQTHPQRRTVRPRRAPPTLPLPSTPMSGTGSGSGLKGRIENEDAVLDVIGSVVKGFAKKYKVRTRDPVRALKALNSAKATKADAPTPILEESKKSNRFAYRVCETYSSGEEEASEPFTVRLELD